jgi:hypothetical protein
MLAGTADRERAVDVLRAGFAEGRLTQDEFTDRVARAYASRTYGDLSQLTADLPAGPAPYPPAVVARLGHTPPAASWSPAAVVERTAASVTGLVLTAAIVFALAVLFTTLAVLLHQGTPGFAHVPYTHTLPYVRHLG